MAKFVKLENGDYININAIRVISDATAKYRIYFDSRLNNSEGDALLATKKDVEKILKASEKSAIYERRPILNESVDRTF